MLVGITLHMSYFLFWFKLFFYLCSFPDVEFDLKILFYVKTLYVIQNLLWFYNY